MAKNGIFCQDLPISVIVFIGAYIIFQRQLIHENALKLKNSVAVLV